MPYIDGQRVSNEEWTARNGSLKRLHTGPNGENPAPSGEVADADIPKGKPKSAGGRRGPRAAKAAKAAIADALGTKPGDKGLEDLDLSGFDADADDGDNKTNDGDGNDADAGDSGDEEVSPS